MNTSAARSGEPSGIGTSRPSRRSRRVRGLAAAVTLSTAAVGVVVFTLPAVTGVSNGARWAQLSGKVTVHEYGDVAEVPAAERPAFLPADARDVTTRRPGPSAVEGGADASSVSVQATVPTQFALPASCVPTSYSQPFDGGGNWPLDTQSDLSSCPGPTGDWTVLLLGGVVYAWR